jgi:hypothetical protein
VDSHLETAVGDDGPSSKLQLEVAAVPRFPSGRLPMCGNYLLRDAVSDASASTDARREVKARENRSPSSISHPENGSALWFPAGIGLRIHIRTIC